MPVRFVSPVAAVALAFGAVSGCSSTDSNRWAEQSSSSVEMRPAQMAARSECEELERRVEIGMPSAFGLHVRDAQEDLAEARELCNSGRTDEGAEMLRGILDYMHEEA